MRKRSLRFHEDFRQARDPGWALLSGTRALDHVATREVCETIAAEIKSFQEGDLADDLTMLALRRTQERPLSHGESCQIIDSGG